MREIRNQLPHDYEDDAEIAAGYLNALYESSSLLLRYHAEATQFVRDHILLEAGRSEWYVFIMKNIQVSLHETSIAGLESVAHHQQKTRAAVIWEAVDAWLREQRIASFENAWIAAAQNDDTPTDDADAWSVAEPWSEE